jgi:type II restriction enzyme
VPPNGGSNPVLADACKSQQARKWKADIAQSVDMYNDWFMKFAPKAFRETRIETTKSVEATLHATENMTNVKPFILRKYPEVLPTLRMSTCPPIAVDRLIGLAGVSSNLVKLMELKKKLPPKTDIAVVEWSARKNWHHHREDGRS